MHGLTERDRGLVRLLDAAGGMDAGSVSRVLGGAPTIAYRRLRALAALGLVRTYRPHAGAPALYLPTRAGTLDATGREGLEPPSVSPTSYSHQLRVGQVIAALEARAITWKSERMMRREQLDAEADGDLAGARRYALRLASSRRSHLPDIGIWVDGSPEPIAVEIELSEKAPGRLRAILGGYALHMDWGSVTYLCGGDHAERIQRSVQRVAATQPGAAEQLQTVLLASFEADWLEPLIAAGPTQAERTGPDGTLALDV